MNTRFTKAWILIGLFLPVAALGADGDTVVPYPTAPTEVISSVYQVTVNGVSVPVIRYKGTESTTLAYASFGFAGTAQIAVTLLGRPFPAGCQLSPHSYRIGEQVVGGQMLLSLDCPRKLVLHYGGAKGFLNADGITEILFLLPIPLKQILPGRDRLPLSTSRRIPWMLRANLL